MALKFLHKKCDFQLSFQKERISELLSVVNLQSTEISELKHECKEALQKLAFSEGRTKALEDLVETLRLQLQNEIARSTKMEGMVLNNYQASTEKFEELASQIYDEDPKELKELYKEFEDQKGEL